MPSDPAIQQAREHHRRAAEALALAERHRQQRDALIRRAREDDPGRWSYGALAAAVGCSKELIAAIVKGRICRGATTPGTCRTSTGGDVSRISCRITEKRWSPRSERS